MAIFPILFYVAAWVVTIVVVNAEGASFFLELTRFTLLFSVGCQGVWAFFGHFFMSERVAKHIGWQSNNFQKEIAFANLGYGVLGLLCFLASSLWLATAIGFTIFSLGAAYVHVRDMLNTKNFALGNAGPIFYIDILAPLTLWVGLLVSIA